MSQSALLGDPPITPDDELTAVAIKALAGSEFFPNKAHTYGKTRPASNPPNTSNGSNIIGLAAFFIALTFLITLGRLIIRSRQKKVSLGVDDFFIVPAAATAIVCNAIVLYISLDECYTRHIYWCTYANFANQYEALYVNQTIFWVALYFSKISIIFNNRRLTAFTNGYWRVGHWVVLAIICICFALALFTTIFECSPVKAHYNLIDLGKTLMADPKSLHCINSTKLTLANRWLHVATDLLLLSIPLIILYRLQMPLRKKLSVGFIFCFGIVCVIASIQRNEVWKRPTEDFTFDSGTLIIWDLVDVNFAPIVASLPVYYPVLNWLFQITKSKLPSSSPSGTSLSQDGEKSLSSVAGLKDKILHHKSHKVASPEPAKIKGPFVRPGDTHLQAIADGKGERAKDMKQSVFFGRESLGTDSGSSDSGSLPTERWRMREEFELPPMGRDEEEAFRPLSLRF